MIFIIFFFVVFITCCPTVSQVQLLVSDSDVENYKQIKTDLDELRLLVEKSELWVYKMKDEGGGGSSKKKGANNDDEDGGGEKEVRDRRYYTSMRSV